MERISNSPGVPFWCNYGEAEFPPEIKKNGDITDTANRFLNDTRDKAPQTLNIEFVCVFVSICVESAAATPEGKNLNVKQVVPFENATLT